MLSLIIELSLVFIIAALIGWLMGRYLCKSGEYEQRSQNKQLSKSHARLQTQLSQQEKEYQSSLTVIHQSKNQLAEFKQQTASLKSQLGIMNDERGRHLKQLQESSQCETRLNALTEDYELERQLLRKQKGQNIELKNQIDELINNGHTQEKNLGDIEKKLNKTTLELNNTTQAYEDQATELSQLQIVAEQQQATLDENNELRSKFKLTHDENDILKTRSQQSNEDYTQLQAKCSKLSEESLRFAEKLATLNNEKNDLSRLIETMTIEKNDYLGRLRAISSVVDVVGTEAVNNEE